MLKVAIIGAGPSGCYTAKYLLRHFPSASIAIFDRLFVPFGLVRYGIAPDHQDIKVVTKEFTSLFKESQNRIRFIGNVNVSFNEETGGLPFEKIRSEADLTILTHGAQRIVYPHWAINGPVWSARKFVEWVNHHPDELVPSDHLLQAKPGTDLAIVGLGNVALDAARIALSQTLSVTDARPSAVDWLKNRFSRVHIIGRGSAEKSKFTNRELREILPLKVARNAQLWDSKDRKSKRKLDIWKSIPEWHNDTSSKIIIHCDSNPLEIKRQDDKIQLTLQTPNGLKTQNFGAVLISAGSRIDEPKELLQCGAGTNNFDGQLKPIWPAVFSAGWAQNNGKGAIAANLSTISNMIDTIKKTGIYNVIKKSDEKDLAWENILLLDRNFVTFEKASELIKEENNRGIQNERIAIKMDWYDAEKFLKMKLIH